VQEARREQFMATQARISAARLQAKVGTIQRVLIDEHAERTRGRRRQRIGVGRSVADAPEIDGLVYVHDGGDAPPGSFVDVSIADADAHDLHGRRASTKPSPR